MLSNLEKLIESQNELLQSTKENLTSWGKEKSLPAWAKQSIEELILTKNYKELNNRFYKSLEFGTGGIRNRTIGETITQAEQGSSITSAPEHTAIGSVYLNDINLIRATIALFKYSKKFLQKQKRAIKIPSVVIAYDNRYFSKHFCELASSAWTKLGGEAYIFDGPRSTPELSFSIRNLRTTAGIMITASHNPFHDNGFKAYFEDGAQMTDSHAAGTITEFNKTTLSSIKNFYEKDLCNVNILKKQADTEYVTCVAKSLLNTSYLQNSKIKAVFTPLHGTGGVASIPLLNYFNIDVDVISQQNDFDPTFSTVKSPNPENKEALNIAIEHAKKVNADIVLATDPDGDRLAIAAKNKLGIFEYFTGNIAGAILAEYLISTLINQNKIPETLKHNAAIIKTFVTSPLLEKIAQNYGIKCINTSTGFKWIGKKILNYERILQKKLLKEENTSIIYSQASNDVRREFLLKYSTFFIFGCEESYGCLANDLIRDKDANAAVIMFCELASYLKERNETLCDFRENLYNKYGYFGEDILNIYYEGADGAQKIKNILVSYKNNPPRNANQLKVIEFKNFRTDNIIDEDIETISPEDFFFIKLEDNCKYAVRASGTEPKIKFYLFAESKIEKKLKQTKKEVQAKLASLKEWLVQDTNSRAN